MNILQQHLTQLLQAHPLWHRGANIILAVSGGADSMALAALAASLAQAEEVTLQVVHVQHHLRGAEAERDALLVETFCADQGLCFRRVDINVKEFQEAEGLSLEEAARVLRYRALEEVRSELKAEAIFLGQHQDDQAETVLLNLLRGAGTRGLRGMQETNGYLARPFLSVAKKELVSYCQEQKVPYGEDTTNQDTCYTRNWVRLKVLPLLEEHNPQIKKQLAQGAILASWDEAYLEEAAAKYLTAYGTRLGDFYDTQMGEAFRLLAPALQSRVLRQMLAAAGAKEVSFEHIKALQELIMQGQGNRALDVPGKVRAIYLNDRLTVGKNSVPRAEERASKLQKKEWQRNASKLGKNTN